MSDETAAELSPCRSYEWIRVIDGIQFATAQAVLQRPPKRRPAARTIKLIAYRLAWWADPDGSRVMPSISLISEVCEVDEGTVKTALAVLRDLGLIDPVSIGGRGRGSTRYRLVVPMDLLDRATHRTPAELARGPAR